MKIPGVVLQGLLKCPELSFFDRTTYLTAAMCQPQSVSELAALASASRTATLRSCRKLVELRWMSLARSGRKVRPIALIPLHHQEKMTDSLEKTYDWIQNKGEFLMKSYLDLRVSSDEFVDNARPQFLVNPLSGQVMEYDRYYLKGVAFEFNGPQHSGPTEAYPDEEHFKEQAARDLLKQALSIRAGVRLVIVTADDLRPGAFEKLLPDALPQNGVDETGPYFRTLARICMRYRERAAQSSAMRQAKAAVKT
ncbi:MAG: hypothetical protein Q8P50_06025 [Bacillota bacterium]|nr:hypothetical protein [Bacillota bacterium]